MFAFYKGFDHANDLFNMVGDPRLRVRLGSVQCCHILMVGSRETFSDHADRLAGFDRCRIDLVVNVGDVAYIGHVRIEQMQQPCEYIKNNSRPGVTNVRKVVHRWPTHVHPDTVREQCFQLLLAASQTVIQKDRVGRGVSHRAGVIKYRGQFSG